MHFALNIFSGDKWYSFVCVWFGSIVNGSGSDDTLRRMTCRIVTNVWEFSLWMAAHEIILWAQHDCAMQWVPINKIAFGTCSRAEAWHAKNCCGNSLLILQNTRRWNWYFRLFFSLTKKLCWILMALLRSRTGSNRRCILICCLNYSGKQMKCRVTKCDECIVCRYRIVDLCRISHANEWDTTTFKKKKKKSAIAGVALDVNFARLKYK